MNKKKFVIKSPYKNSSQNQFFACDAMNQIVLPLQQCPSGQVCTNTGSPCVSGGTADCSSISIVTPPTTTTQIPPSTTPTIPLYANVFCANKSPGDYPIPGSSSCKWWALKYYKMMQTVLSFFFIYRYFTCLQNVFPPFGIIGIYRYCALPHYSFNSVVRQCVPQTACA